VSKIYPQATPDSGEHEEEERDWNDLSHLNELGAFAG